MNEKKIEKFIAGAYVITLIGVTMLLMYIAVFEKSDIYFRREAQGVTMFEKTKAKNVIDPEAPLGFREEYDIYIPEHGDSEMVLAFYEVHANIQVYFDDVLMYSLQGATGNKLTRTTGCQWIMVPVYKEDVGKVAHVIVSPIYKSAAGRQYSFMMGPELAIFRTRLKDDMLPILLSAITILTGIAFMVISYIGAARGEEITDIAYVGLFAFFIGLWKITEAKYVTMAFNDSPTFISYFSISMLMICVVPLMFYIKSNVRSRMRMLLVLAAGVATAISLIMLLLQVFRILDFKQMLTFVHISICIAILAIAIAAFDEFRHEKDDPKAKVTIVCFGLCAAGAIVDLVLFYLDSQSSGILFTLVAFLLYIVIHSIFSNRDLEDKANKDGLTGLSNRSRCNDMLEDFLPLDERTGLAMFDLNDLKIYNDTYGHDMGDKLIDSFAKVLRKVVPPDQFLGRYGGDEFMVIWYGADASVMGKLLLEVEKEVRTINNSEGNIQISYSCGFSVSDDHEKECTIMDLFKDADEKMFKEKRAYHRRAAALTE